MELAKIRNLTDEELKRQETISAEQLFRIRFQVALGQNDGVKKLRQLRKEIAQVKTVARERELGIHTEVGEEKHTARAVKHKAAKASDSAEAVEAKPATHKKTHAPAKAKTAKAKKVKSKAGSAAKAKTGKTKKAAAGAAKKKTGKKKGASK
jgi:large subunit ribosomal protein L29